MKGLRAFVVLLGLATPACHDRAKDIENTAVAAPVEKPSSAASGTSERVQPAPLTIAYSDWPGWIAWDIAVEKGFFRDAGVNVRLDWLDYVPSMEAFSEGKDDAVCMTNGDALVTASSGARSVGILLNDFSNGNDMIVARREVKNVADLRHRKIGVEVGFVDHLLLMEALKSASMTEADVEIVDTKTHETPALLKSGSVAAIAAWQPNSGQALDLLPGSKAIFTSANVPGLIYDLLFVSPKSLVERRSDWFKVVNVWFRVAAFIENPATRPEALRIMSARVHLTPEKYGALLDGTFILNHEGNARHFEKKSGFDSVYGSTEAVDKFNIANHTYKESPALEAVLDPTLVAEALAEK
ncbi:MAG TPA: ABC transporter substrate-binding protein [Polyangiaceae bacterium]|nr:ABC transporter substrate-binding protein [Polyangiaceae bacterium]